MNKIKAIIFDFDGVIAESVNVKTEAFAEMYKMYGESVVRKVVEHHEANGGISRFEKFRIYHKDFLGQEIDEKEVQMLARQFSGIVLQKIIKVPYVKRAYEFLSSNYYHYDFFISTGTPTDEIKTILEGRGLNGFFKDVYGSPEKKDAHVRKIMEKYNYTKDEVIFVGDALTDREAAKVNGIKFIGRYTTDAEIKSEKFLINDFDDLNRLLTT